MFSQFYAQNTPQIPPTDNYAFPSVLQSFLDKNASSNTPSSTSDKAPLITDSNDTSSLSSGARRFFMFAAPADSEPESFRGLSRTQRFLYFGISAFCASLFFSLALIFIPLLATPSGLRKFVLMYILGNAALLFACAFAFGPWSYAKSLFTREKIVSTLAYSGSLFLGIYGVIWWRSTLCALLAVVIQVGLGLYQLKQFIWGGTRLFSFFNRLSSLRPGGSQLPI